MTNTRPACHCEVRSNLIVVTGLDCRASLAMTKNLVAIFLSIYHLPNIPLPLSRVGIAHQKTRNNIVWWALPTLPNIACPPVF